MQYGVTKAAVRYGHEQAVYLRARYKLIKPYMPLHNGDGERSHREDN